jgi:hypothetical protein
MNSLLLGEMDRSEFCQARETLAAVGQVVHTRNMDEASAALTDPRSVPELIVIIQSFPGQFSHTQIDCLRRLAPLCRIVALLGSWCEGESRSGHPCPGVIRIYWHQWVARAGRELSWMARGEPSAWSLPLTAAEEERLLTQALVPWSARQGLIAIYSRRGEMADWLSSACRDRGYSTVWLRPPNPARVEGAAAGFFDGSDLRGMECEELSCLSATLSPAPVVVLLDFPRIEDARRARAAGAAAMLSKPLLIDDLFWQLDNSECRFFR